MNIKASSGKAKVVGTVVCIGGAILLVVYKGIPLFNRSHLQAERQAVDQMVGLSSAKRAERWTLGSMLMIVGTLLWSSWFLIQSNIGRRYPCQYSSTAIMSFFAAIQSATLTLCIDRNLSIWVLRGNTEILSVLYAVSIRTDSK